MTTALDPRAIRVAQRSAIALGLKKPKVEAARPAIGFTEFKHLLFKRYQQARHLDYIDDALMQAARYAETGGREGVAQTIIETPPRHGKSLTTSRLFPAWFIGRNPDMRIILGSYGETLAAKHSRVARNIVGSEAFRALFPGVQLAKDSYAANAWDIANHTGGMDAVGVGSGVTGKGGDLLIIDDPVKSREEAEHENQRDKTWDWYTDDFLSRRERVPGSAIVVIGTRWNQDDLIGRLLRNQPGKWREIRLPAIAEGDDPLGRMEGAALWPERFDVEALHSIEADLGPYGWASLYQQRPTPAEGGLFKNLHIVDAMPPIVRSWRYWDLAMSAKTSADFTVGLRLDECADGHFYVSDVARARLDWGNVPEYMAGVMLADGPEVSQGIEEQGYMSRAISDLNIDPRFHHFSIWGYKVDKDKLTRALAPAAKMAAGTLHILRAHWTDDFCEELKMFPAGAHDDQVDALSGVWGMVDEYTSGISGGLNYNYAGGIPGAW